MSLRKSHKVYLLYRDRLHIHNYSFFLVIITIHNLLIKILLYFLYKTEEIILFYLFYSFLPLSCVRILTTSSKDETNIFHLQFFCFCRVCNCTYYRLYHFIFTIISIFIFGKNQLHIQHLCKFTMSLLSSPYPFTS